MSKAWWDRRLLRRDLEILVFGTAPMMSTLSASLQKTSGTVAATSNYNGDPRRVKPETARTPRAAAPPLASRFSLARRLFPSLHRFGSSGLFRLNLA